MPNNSQILIADDDAHCSGLIADFMRAKSGLECACVRTGEELLELCERGRPAMVILDGLLPRIRGDEVARRLRQKYSTEEVPIVFISAFFRDRKSHIYLTRECGVNLVLHKPFTDADLSKAVAKLNGGVALFPTASGQAAVVSPPSLPEYVAASRERIRAMASAIEALTGPSKEDALKMLQVEAHRFSGAGASFGLDEVSRIGRELEVMLQQQKLPVPSSTRARASGMIEALASVLARTAGEVPFSAPSSDEALSVLLVDTGSDLAQSCQAQSGRHRLRAFANVEDALQEAIYQSPHIAFVAGDRPEIDALAVCHRLSAAGVARVALLGGRADLADRLRALSAGAVGYVPRPGDAQGLMRFAVALGAGGREGRGGRVLAVDENRGSLERIAALLGPHELEVVPCLDPSELFGELSRVEPSLVILSATFSKHSGIDLLRALRADPLYRFIPVMVLAASGAWAERMNALEHGADDVLDRPFSDEELAARVLVQVRRRLVDEANTSRDALTGAFRRGYLLDACERSLALARRTGRCLALLAFSIELNGADGPLPQGAWDEIIAATAGRLRAAFRATDVVSRIAVNRFAVLLEDIAPGEAHKLLQRELTAFARLPPGERPVPMMLTGGLAAFPDVSSSAEAMLRVAESALST